MPENSVAVNELILVVHWGRRVATRVPFLCVCSHLSVCQVNQRRIFVMGLSSPFCYLVKYAYFLA